MEGSEGGKTEERDQKKESGEGSERVQREEIWEGSEGGEREEIWEGSEGGERGGNRSRRERRDQKQEIGGIDGR